MCQKVPIFFSFFNEFLFAWGNKAKMSKYTRDWESELKLRFLSNLWKKQSKINCLLELI